MIILRHDVDKKPGRSLRTAEIENELGIKATYYFRVVKNILPNEVIERIVKLGHEIGYHYDDLNAAKGVVENALKLFQKNLAKLRELVPIKTACMHGSPLSRHDNRKLWESHNYESFGIIGEPYFDIDFNEVMYLTDTGRRWDGEVYSIRDKVGNQKTENRGQKSEKRDDSNIKEKIKWPKYHSTQDIINALKNNELPDQIMLTVHPQRWTDEWIPWIYELVSQNIKNGVKYLMVRGQR